MVHTTSKMKTATMRWRYFLLPFFFFLPCITYAQYEDEEERDAILNNPNGAGAARKAQLESAWSLSDSQFRFKEVRSEGGWHTEDVHTHINPIGINIAPNNTPEKKNIPRQPSSPPKKKSQPSPMGTHRRDNSDFLKRRNAEIAEAQKRASEEKQEAARRDKLRRIVNMAKQAERHNESMAAYRSQNYQKAAEAITKVTNFRATSLANIPEGKAELKVETESGKDLANLLKKSSLEKASSTYVQEGFRERKRNVHFNQEEEGNINIWDDGDLNIAEVMQWKKTLSESQMASFPDKLQEVPDSLKPFTASLINHLDADISQLPIITLPQYGCVVLARDSLMLLDSDGQTLVPLECKQEIEQIIVCGNKTFGKYRNSILEIKGQETSIFCNLDLEHFTLYEETDSTFIINASKELLNVVVRINIDTREFTELIRIPYPILKVASNKTVVLALTPNGIVDVSNGIPQLFYQSSEGINDICMCDLGLLVATNSHLLLISSKDKAIIFSKERILKLWYDGEDIYFLTQEGDLKRFSYNN